MKNADTLDSLELSLLPAILASSCCLTFPGLALLGISLGENIFYEYKVLLRFLAVLVLLVSLIYYFYKKGIRSKSDYITHKNKITIIILQTIFFSLVLYALFLLLFVPVLCVLTEVTSCAL